MSLQNLENLGTIFRFPWKKSKRTIAEQLIGFFLFLSTIFTIIITNSWIVKNSMVKNWYIPFSLQNIIWTVASFFISCSFWILWRRISFKDLKLESAFLSANLVLIVIWHILFFFLNEPFLGLIVNLMLLGSAILCFYTFWRKDKLAGLIFSAYLFWIGVITALNMFICI